jgi:hypothetical protein
MNEDQLARLRGQFEAGILNKADYDSLSEGVRSQLGSFETIAHPSQDVSATPRGRLQAVLDAFAAYDKDPLRHLGEGATGVTKSLEKAVGSDLGFIPDVHADLWSGARFPEVRELYPKIAAIFDKLKAARDEYLRNPPRPYNRPGMATRDVIESMLAPIRQELFDAVNEELKWVDPKPEKSPKEATDPADVTVIREQDALEPGGDPWLDGARDRLARARAILDAIDADEGSVVPTAEVRAFLDRADRALNTVYGSGGKGAQLEVGSELNPTEGVITVETLVNSAVDHANTLAGGNLPRGWGYTQAEATADYHAVFQRLFTESLPATAKDRADWSPDQKARAVLAAARGATDYVKSKMPESGFFNDTQKTFTPSLSDTKSAVNGVLGGQVSSPELFRLMDEDWKTTYGVSTGASTNVVERIVAQNTEALSAKVRDAKDPMTGEMARRSFSYMIDTLRALGNDDGELTPEDIEKEEALLAGFVGLSPEQARTRAADIIKNRIDVRKIGIEQEQQAFNRAQGLEALAESRALEGREEQIGIRTDIRDLQQRQQEQQTGIHRAVAAAQQQLASEYLGHAPQFGPVTPGAKIGGANIYETLAASREIGEPGYIPYGGPVPGVPQASDMAAFHEALASARAKVAYGTEPQMLHGLPTYEPAPGLTAPQSPTVI